MATVEVFDPAMCCSTGVCGTDVDPTLSRFAADLEWLSAQGVQVTRATLSQEPGKFAGNPLVAAVLTEQGVQGLPAVLVDGEVRATGRYPDRTELAGWAAVPAPAARVLPLAQQTGGGCCGGTGGC
jgi:hypothetical protein